MIKLKIIIFLKKKIVNVTDISKLTDLTETKAVKKKYLFFNFNNIKIIQYNINLNNIVYKYIYKKKKKKTDCNVVGTS